MEFLAGIGGITLFILLVYLVTKHYSNQDSEKERLRQLMMDSGQEYDFDNYWKKNPELSYEKALRSFFDSTRMETAIQEQKIKQKKWKETKDGIKREWTVKRVYGYSYENFIYYIFSPLAELYGNEWKCTKPLPCSYVRVLIGEKYNLGDIQSKELFDKFVSNELLSVSTDNTNMCRLGFVLDTGANLINDSDLNMDRYIKKYGKRLTKEELHDELEVLTPIEEVSIGYKWSKE